MCATRILSRHRTVVKNMILSLNISTDRQELDGILLHMCRVELVGRHLISAFLAKLAMDGEVRVSALTSYSIPLQRGRTVGI